VYDYSHVGHARSYVGFDILRRILEDYFGYNIVYVVNVTDVDDKIIKKGNLVLLNNLVSYAEKSKLGEVGKEAEERLKFIKNRIYEDSVSPDKALKTVEITKYVSELKELGKKKFSKEQLEEQPPFVEVARKYEKLFWEDMRSLGVKYPDVITRVTEYIKDIITFVEKIIKNGYAYESNGSVYFDTQKFDKTPNHCYAKLEPFSVKNQDKLNEGEGEWVSQKKRK